MKLNKDELGMIAEALENRISDIKSWLEEGELVSPWETLALKTRRAMLKSHQGLLDKVEKAYRMKQ